ncbi:MAG: YdcF family protein [Acidimicrobiia bacterium]
MKRFLIVSSLLVVALVASAVVLVTSPPETDSRSGDAVMVHAGGRGDRLQAGLALMGAGASTTLVIMNGTAEEWPEANALCGQAEPFLVLCPDTSIDNTVGEARTLAELAAERQWRSVVVVSSDYHLRRASIIDRRCAEGVEIRPVAAQADISTSRRVLLTLREVLALPQAYTTGCG